MPLVPRRARMIVALAFCLLSAASPGQPPAASPAEPPFAQQTPPPAPDYTLASSWAAGAADAGAAATVPEGAIPAARHPGVDVFYIHPTTYLSNTRWNQDIADAQANAWVDASVIARQASIFNACCRVFAPRYRQASHLALSHYDGEGQQALALAYDDVERAFDHYITHDNHGRPFILVGHSQGALHLAKLLSRRIDGTPLRKRMVAAYVVGLTLLADDAFGGTYKTLRSCDTPAQTGCVLGWNSMLPTADLPKTRLLAAQSYARGNGHAATRSITCINPLTFDRSKPDATIADSKGAVPGDPGAAPARPLVPHAVSGRCDDGLLVVAPNPALSLKPLPNDSLHYHDFGLYYEDIRENAVLRAATFLRAHPAHQQRAPHKTE